MPCKVCKEGKITRFYSQQVEVAPVPDLGWAMYDLGDKYLLCSSCGWTVARRLWHRTHEKDGKTIYVYDDYVKLTGVDLGELELELVAFDIEYKH